MKPGHFFSRCLTRLIGGALVVAVSGLAQAATMVVTRTNDDGTRCDATGCTLRAAIQAAQAGDEIAFSPDLPYPVTIRLGSALALPGISPSGTRYAVR